MPVSRAAPILSRALRRDDARRARHRPRAARVRLRAPQLRPARACRRDRGRGARVRPAAANLVRGAAPRQSRLRTAASAVRGRAAAAACCMRHAKEQVHASIGAQAERHTSSARRRTPTEPGASLCSREPARTKVSRARHGQGPGRDGEAARSRARRGRGLGGDGGSARAAGTRPRRCAWWTRRATWSSAAWGRWTRGRRRARPSRRACLTLHSPFTCLSSPGMLHDLCLRLGLHEPRS